MSRDGRDMNTDSRGNRVSRVAGIKHSEDSVFCVTEGNLMVIIIENKEVCELF